MERVSINLLEIGEKARSKSELYKILTVEGALYLPPYKVCSVDFMADIIVGKRKVLDSKDVVIRILPHINGLRIDDLLKFLINVCNAENYLPPKYDEINLHRDWLGNLCKNVSLIITIGNSLMPDQFDEYVKEKLASRQKSIIQTKYLSVEALPKFANLFKSSLMVSTHRGKSNLMLNREKRSERINRAEQEEEKLSEKEIMIEQLKREVNNLKNELDLAYDLQEKADQNAAVLEKLFESNIIDEEGNLKSPKDFIQE